MVEIAARVRDTQGNLAERLIDLALGGAPGGGYPYAPGERPPPPPVLPPPSDVVKIGPGENLQAAFNAHPEGTKFRVLEGRYKVGGYTPSPRLRQEVWGDVDAAGRPLVILDCEWAPWRKGFDANHGVQFHNAVVERFLLPSFQDPAVEFKAATAGKVSNVIARRGIGYGFGMGASHGWNLEVHNTSHSFTCGDESSIGRPTHALLEHFHVHHINTFDPDPEIQAAYQRMRDEELGRWDRTPSNGEGLRRSNYNTSWKFARSERTTVRWGEVGPEVHGAGIWYDIENVLYDVYGIHFHDNPSGGGFIEVSFGGRFHHCLFERVKRDLTDWHVNAWALFNGESPGIDPNNQVRDPDPRKMPVLAVEFDNNIVRESIAGIGIRQGSGRWDEKMASRDLELPPAGVYKRVCNLYVRENLFEDISHFAVGLNSSGTTAMEIIDPSYAIRYQRNNYRRVGTEVGGKAFKWASPTSSNLHLTWQQWRDLGQDEGGSFEAAA